MYLPGSKILTSVLNKNTILEYIYNIFASYLLFKIFPNYINCYKPQSYWYTDCQK